MAGVSIVTTLNTFTTSYLRASTKVANLSASIASTSSVLVSLESLIRENEKSYRFTVTNFLGAKEDCTQNSKALEDVLKKIKEESMQVSIPPANRKAGVGIWERMKFAMGGEQELDGLANIESSKSTLQLLLDSVKLMILQKLSKRNTLSEDQAEDLKLLVYHVPALLLSLQKSGLLDSPSRKPAVSHIPKHHDGISATKSHKSSASGLFGGPRSSED